MAPNPPMRRCAISVDLDEIEHYHAIHGLHATRGSHHPVYDIALPRFAAFAAEHTLPLTLFVVTRDLGRPENVEALQSAAAAGHELGNHSRNHLYDLVRRSRDEQRSEIAGGADDLERALGVRPRGFRAPGYTVTDELLEIVRETGHVYDSSVFPCPAYYTAKAAALALQRVVRRPSRSILDSPGVLAAPTRPYRIGRRYTERGEGLHEFPIQVTRGPRLPYIGTALTMAGPIGARALTELVIGEPFINLELHGIDLLDVDDGLEALRGYQPDVGVTASRKRAILSRVVKRLKQSSYDFVRLGEMVEG